MSVIICSTRPGFRTGVGRPAALLTKACWQAEALCLAGEQRYDLLANLEPVSKQQVF